MTNDGLIVNRDVLSRMQYKRIKCMNRLDMSEYLYNLCLSTARNVIVRFKFPAYKFYILSSTKTKYYM